jgi:hypothetical protein
VSSKALATFADERLQPLLQLAQPSFRMYARLHGYDLVVPDLTALRSSAADLPYCDADRPASWYKLTLMRGLLLAGYECVLWLDADTVIVDATEDLASRVPGPCPTALVVHITPSGNIPNCGVWFCRRDFEGTLLKLWSMTHHIHGGWWEQAAFIELLGSVSSPLFRKVCWLNEQWNVVPTHANWPVRQPRILHASGMGNDPRRVQLMARWAQGDYDHARLC